MSVRERDMAYVSEILCVDPSVDDIETIACGPRPVVEASTFGSATPAAQQITAALSACCASLRFWAIQHTSLSESY